MGCYRCSCCLGASAVDGEALCRSEDPHLPLPRVDAVIGWLQVVLCLFLIAIIQAPPSILARFAALACDKTLEPAAAVANVPAVRPVVEDPIPLASLTVIRPMSGMY